jgi:ribonuclease D
VSEDNSAPQEARQPAEEIVSEAAALARCCEYLTACPVIGLDTEFVGEDTYHPRICLVQVATPERLFLIDPLSSGPLDAFWKLVIDPARLVVVHAGREEVRLCQLWAGHPPGHLFDLQIAAGLTGFQYPIGHGPLVNHLLGIRLAKGETLTEWRERPLTRSQIRYAFDDVRYLLSLWKSLNERLERHGRAGWAAEEFKRLKRTALATPSETEKFRKLKGLGSLDRRKLAVVRELYAWREERAAQLNRPARTVVRDDLLVEIARRNPTRDRDLQVVRGLAKREMSAIVEVVNKARAIPPELYPEPVEREQDPPQVQMITSILTALLGDWCARHEVAPSLAASNNDVRLLVRARRQCQELPEESSLTRGWRAAHLLPEVLAMLDGKRSLRIGNVTSATPFAFEG